MFRRLKTLGLLMMALFALSAVGASASQAANFTASEYPASYTGTNLSGNEVFSTEAGRMECNTHYSGAANGASETLTVHPTFTSCKTFGFLTATVTTTGCDYLFHITSGSGDVYNTSTDIVCSESNQIIIVTSGCEVKIGSQTGLTNVKFTNDTAAGDITVDWEIKNQLTYNVTKDIFPCPHNGTGVRTTGSYESTVAATIDSAQTIGIG